MVLPLAAEQQTEPRTTQPPSVIGLMGWSASAIWFAVGFAIAAVLTAAATAFALSGAGVAGPASPAITVMLSAALALCVALTAILAHRIIKIARASEAGARLHLRFVVLFSLAAVAPAVIVAAFLGVSFGQGVERWFSNRVESTIENAADVGAAYLELASDNLGAEVQVMSEDLNAARQGLTDDRARYLNFLELQREGRLLRAAYVVDRNGAILAQAPQTGAPDFPGFTTEGLRIADSGEVSVRFDETTNRAVAVSRLAAYSNAYVVATRDLERVRVAQLLTFDQAVFDYRNAQDERGSLRLLFVLSYLATAWLVLLAAVWLGLENATRISEPIGRLAAAARRVASGDLKARVTVGEEHDEVEALGGAFNQMTSQLEAQRRDLVTAQEEAVTRSLFTEAVLGGVSAGVVGIDRDGRITAANTSAAKLLGHGDDNLVGRRLVDVAPEFAELLNQPAPSAGATAVQRVDLVRESVSANLGVRMGPDASGGFVLTFDDMTTVISAQRQEAWKDVARRIAHEIKNPLTPIQLSADRLKRKYLPEITSDPETFQKCTDTILRQVADIERMVDEFSSLARMPTPRMAFADMSEIARSTVFGQRLAFADLRIEVEGVDQPIGLVCDERLIAQSLLNLTKNAAESVQARRARDGEPKDGFVIVRVRELEYGVQVEVIDNGLGFPAQNRERLLEPYVTTRARGTGLGLAIVARVIEDHGGLIELDDPPGPGPGAIVRIVLPKRGEEPPATQ